MLGSIFGISESAERKGGVFSGRFILGWKEGGVSGAFFLKKLKKCLAAGRRMITAEVDL